ncbi:hydroxyethylthiazole kinase-like uncharacterized protein yjeF [Novosphingobium capsulatum]|uniref:ADP-dependent (S)-NAD(P)H-hydrate dehydratase n=1 Tax=Novosphingobium capsulatum TaxID=13688 RepID=A0ABU1MKB4_9SPHN|nr:NAD(P)H-hydrate dehydratase [Novosphingobium capsulatum]MDR6510471.1 hydroxyethylthiazole kinase-like uncharacterized protein yjeF [Novosphingobium capsulatum]
MADARDATPQRIDLDLLAQRPLPEIAQAADKNSRGRVCVLGGSAQVPGGVALTAEAALRAGAGKVRIGTIAPAAVTVGCLVPEAAVLALPISPAGEIATTVALLEEAVRAADAVVVGPAMSCGEHGAILARQTLALVTALQGIVLDAAALLCLECHREHLAATPGHVVLTPHIGEMAAMLACKASVIEADRPGAVRHAAKRFNAVAVLKGPTTFIATPKGHLFAYNGGSAGLATGGSGDVLAGIIGALLARGATGLDAALWGAWVHGEAGRRCSAAVGPIGYLARELLGFIPRLLHSAQQLLAPDRREASRSHTR